MKILFFKKSMNKKSEKKNTSEKADSSFRVPITESGSFDYDAVPVGSRFRLKNKDGTIEVEKVGKDSFVLPDTTIPIRPPSSNPKRMPTDQSEIQEKKDIIKQTLSTSHGIDQDHEDWEKKARDFALSCGVDDIRALFIGVIVDEHLHRVTELRHQELLHYKRVESARILSESFNSKRSDSIDRNSEENELHELYEFGTGVHLLDSPRKLEDFLERDENVRNDHLDVLSRPLKFSITRNEMRQFRNARLDVIQHEILSIFTMQQETNESVLYRSTNSTTPSHDAVDFFTPSFHSGSTSLDVASVSLLVHADHDDLAIQEFGLSHNTSSEKERPKDLLEQLTDTSTLWSILTDYTSTASSVWMNEESIRSQGYDGGFIGWYIQSGTYNYIYEKLDKNDVYILSSILPPSELSLLVDSSGNTVQDGYDYSKLNSIVDAIGTDDIYTSSKILDTCASEVGKILGKCRMEKACLERNMDENKSVSINFGDNAHAAHLVGRILSNSSEDEPLVAHNGSSFSVYTTSDCIMDFSSSCLNKIGKKENVVDWVLSNNGGIVCSYSGEYEQYLSEIIRRKRPTRSSEKILVVVPREELETTYFHIQQESGLETNQVCVFDSVPPLGCTVYITSYDHITPEYLSSLNRLHTSGIILVRPKFFDDDLDPSVLELLLLRTSFRVVFTDAPLTDHPLHFYELAHWVHRSKPERLGGDFGRVQYRSPLFTRHDGNGLLFGIGSSTYSQKRFTFFVFLSFMNEYIMMCNYSSFMNNYHEIVLDGFDLPEDDEISEVKKKIKKGNVGVDQTRESVHTTYEISLRSELENLYWNSVEHSQKKYDSMIDILGKNDVIVVDEVQKESIARSFETRHIQFSDDVGDTSGIVRVVHPHDLMSIDLNSVETLHVFLYPQIVASYLSWSQGPSRILSYRYSTPIDGSSWQDFTSVFL